MSLVHSDLLSENALAGLEQAADVIVGINSGQTAGETTIKVRFFHEISSIFPRILREKFRKNNYLISGHKYSIISDFCVKI